MAQGYLNNITFNEYIQYLIDYQVSPEIAFQQLESLYTKDRNDGTWFLPGLEVNSNCGYSLHDFIQVGGTICMRLWENFLACARKNTPRYLHAELNFYRRVHELPVLIRTENGSEAIGRNLLPVTRQLYLSKSCFGWDVLNDLFKTRFADDLLALPRQKLYLLPEEVVNPVNGTKLQELLSTLQPTISTPQLIGILIRVMTEKPAVSVPAYTHSVVDPACSHGMNDSRHLLSGPTQHAIKVSNMGLINPKFTEAIEYVRLNWEQISASPTSLQPKGTAMNHTTTLNTATLVKLADPGYAREVEQFTGNTQDDGLKDAIQEALKNERKLQLESAANSIISLLRKADEATEQRVSQLRAIRKSEQDKLAELKKVSLARAYGKETNNWIPLCRLVLPYSQWPEVTNEDIVREVPKDWKPTGATTPAAAPVDQPTQAPTQG